MRAFLLILIIGVVVVIIAFASGFLHLNQTRDARIPSVAVAGNGVVAKGGQAPSFEVETGSVAVGTERKEVTLPKVSLPVPALKVNRPVDQPQTSPAPGNSVSR